MTLRKGLLAATMLALPMAAANAQPVTGLYIGAGVGANWRADGDFDKINGTYKTDVGYAALGALGWGFGNGLRTSSKSTTATTSINRASPASARSAPVAGGGAPAGDERQVRVAILDLRLHVQRPLRLPHAGSPWVVPYVGAGVGIAWTQWNGSRSGLEQLHADRHRPAPPPPPPRSAAPRRKFAYQAIVGAAFPLGSVPGLALTTNSATSARSEPVLWASDRPASARRRVRQRQRLGRTRRTTTSPLLVGMRYNFGVAPPPAPMAAPPAPPPVARTYLVFFDWDRADLTTRAKEIIAEAAENSRRVQTTRIEVAGHADRSGTPAYNQRLSQRRADNVAAELVRRGVPRTIISVTAYGESRPLVPTADGVREPQNRRVEIVLR